MTAPEAEGAGWFYGLLPRLVSFFLALALATAILLMPHWFTGPKGEAQHGPLLLLMWGLAAGFTHGVGFVPRNRFLRVALGPAPAWVLLAAGAWWAVSGASG